MFNTIISRIIAPPKNVHVLILRTCEDVTLHFERDFADMIKDKDSESKIFSWIIK